MKPILLLYPPFEGKTLLVSRPPFPIGPLYIASYLQQYGIKSSVVDMSYPPARSVARRPRQLETGQSRYVRFGWLDDEIEWWLHDQLPKYHRVVGVSTLMSSNWTGGYRLVELIKKVNPKVTVVMGGPHATAYLEHVFANSLTDYVCVGEGEECFHRFLLGQEQASIVAKSDFQTRLAVPTPVQDMDSLPFLDRDCLQDDRELKEIYVTFSRGCPYRCSFCGSHLIQGRKWRFKSVGRCIAELIHYQRLWDVKRFLIEDDNLCPGSEGVLWLRELCTKIIEEKMGTYFHISHGIPVNFTADPENCELLWKAGFRRMVFPLESTNKEVLRDMCKGFTLKGWAAAVQNWREYETARPTEIIIGYPFVETIESMLTTMLDVAKAGCTIWASHFRLNKGTALYDRCLEANYITGGYDPINTQALYIETERFNLKDLQELMQIGRGLNYITRDGKAVFPDNPFPYFREARYGDVVAEGNFKFKRGEAIAAAILLTATGKYTGRPQISALGSDRLVFLGVKPSRVYDILKKLLVGSKTSRSAKEYFGWT